MAVKPLSRQAGPPLEARTLCTTSNQTADIAVAVLPVAILLGLILCYRVDSRFYLAHVLHPHSREYQIVELATFVCSLIGSLLMAAAAWRLWRCSPVAPGKSVPSKLLVRRAGPLLVAVVSLATFFFAGEEISWGQSYLQWRVPESIKDTMPETNLHNIHGLPISINSLGSLFLLVVFVFLPIAWRWRKQLGLPTSLAPAIAEWPIVFGMIVAFLWKLFKSCYVLLVENYEQRQFYIEFVEQINEQKEMLAAVCLLFYGLYRLSSLRRT